MCCINWIKPVNGWWMHHRRPWNNVNIIKRLCRFKINLLWTGVFEWMNECLSSLVPFCLVVPSVTPPSVFICTCIHSSVSTYFTKPKFLKILRLHLFFQRWLITFYVIVSILELFMNVVAPPAVGALELCFHIPTLLHVLAYFLQIMHCNNTVDLTLPATVPQSMPLCFVRLCSFMDFLRLEAYLRDVIHHSRYNVQQTFF